MRLARTTIAAVVSATEITLTSASGTSASGVTLIWGTNDTDALAATATAKHMPTEAQFTLPLVVYIFTALPLRFWRDCGAPGFAR